MAGRYELRRVVGRGGMGVLWAAHDRILGREVAVKEVRLPADLSADESSSLRERALREARAAARVTHPSAVTVYDVVEAEGRPWIVMELLPPRTLANVLAEDGPLPPAAAARLGLDLLDALAFAHAAGVVHRDVKPGNILLADGRAVLVDFGIATLDDDPMITAAGMLLGSPAFMPPERARGEEPTPASDLWSLGATLFAVVEGQPPFRRDGHLPTLAAVVTQEAPAAEHAGPLRSVLAALLARDPAERPSAEQARAMLLAAAQGGTIEPVPAPSMSGIASAIVVDTVESPPADRAPEPSPVHLPRQWSHRVGALAVVMLAPAAVVALAVGLPMPWQQAAVPTQQQPAASSGTPATTARARPAASPARSAPTPSRSAARTTGTPRARAQAVVVSWDQRPGESPARVKDKKAGHDTSHAKGKGDGHGDGKD